MQDNQSIPSTGFMRLPAILSVIPVSKSTWWAGVKSGRYPKAVKLGERITAWRAEDICLGARKINLCRALAGQLIGIREVEPRIWLVSFMQYDLGFFDEDDNRVEPATNPFAEKLLPMSSV